MDKKLLVVLSLSSLLVITSCDKTRAFKKDFAGNMELIENQSANITVLDKVTFDSAVIDHGKGLFTITNADETKDIYSIAAKKNIVKIQKDETVRVNTNYDNMSYVIVNKQATDSEGKTTNTFKIYDSLGNLVHEENEDYLTTTLKISHSTSNTIIEEINYTKKSGENVTACYTLNKDGTRNSQVRNANNLLEYFNNSNDSFKYVGVDGYVIIPFSVNDGFGASVYKEKNKKLVNTIIIEGSDKDFLFACSGKIYYSVTTKLPMDAQEYDYLKPNPYSSSSYESAFIKYNFDLFAVDIINGKTNEVNTDFIIESANIRMVETMNKEESVIKYIPAKIRKIKDNKLLDELETVILDDNQNIVFSSNVIDITSLEKISKDRYLANYISSTIANTTKLLLDKDLNILCEIKNPLVDTKNQVIYCQFNGSKYGAINFNLDIITQFEYDAISNYIFNDKVIVTKNSKSDILNKGVYERTLTNNEVFDSSIFVIKTTNAETNQLSYITLSGDLVLTVELATSVSDELFYVLDTEYVYFTYKVDGKTTAATFVIER